MIDNNSSYVTNVNIEYFINIERILLTSLTFAIIF